MYLPAAIILETVQSEGGLNVASNLWLQGISDVAKKIGALLIVDEIQTGCGRTGPFFSFERAGIVPDLVCLSKSLSGFGLPLSVVLIKPEFDQWEPLEHNVAFRANNLALLSGSVALDMWSDPKFLTRLSENAKLLWSLLANMLPQCGREVGDVRGIGMLCGIPMDSPELARAVQRSAFERGLLVETCGPLDQFVKLMPPLNIEPDILQEGVSTLIESINSNTVAFDCKFEKKLHSYQN
jgi:diaminobutyrate-2-oxoglutarate transaminase